MESRKSDRSSGDYGTGTCCLYCAVRSGFEGGKSITRDILGGVPKNWDFSGPEMATSAASAIGAIWAQKSRITRIKQQNSFIDMVVLFRNGGSPLL